MVTTLPVSTILLITGFGLVLIGLWGMLTQRHLIRIALGFALIDTGLHIVMVSTGYVTNGTAPIIDRALSQAEAGQHAIDPVPSALVVTAIVIGFSVTAIMLSYAVQLYAVRKTFDIGASMDSKW
jgi:multicomponent Na+:H+ antiporter subunit C